MEAKAQVESGAVDCGESDDEQPREVGPALSFSLPPSNSLRVYSSSY